MSRLKPAQDAIVICGTTGESSTLSHQEHLDAIRFCVKHTAGRVPVIAGTGSNSTKEAVYMSEEAEKSGADALLLVTPYYNKATQKGTDPPLHHDRGIREPSRYRSTAIPKKNPTTKLSR